LTCLASDARGNVAQSRVVAAFDFDGTLTRGDTLLPYLAMGLGWAPFSWLMLKSGPWLLAYACRLLPNHVVKARVLRGAFAGLSVAEVAGWTSRWLPGLPAQMRPEALAQLTAHQRAGHCCVMVSASPDVYLQRAAEHLGFDALICTEMAVDAGVLTGAMRTPNCHGEEKRRRLTDWLARRQGDSKNALTLYAYGDTRGDLPMLGMANHAWYRGKPWTKHNPRS
jgi:phosphatidylglycerophosphatase C